MLAGDKMNIKFSDFEVAVPFIMSSYYLVQDMHAFIPSRIKVQIDFVVSIVFQFVIILSGVFILEGCDNVEIRCINNFNLFNHLCDPFSLVFNIL